MYVYDTLTAAVADLGKRGYEHDFNLEGDCLACKALNIKLRPQEFQIDEFYRFEGMTDPADSAVVYAVSSPSSNFKGILIDAYGVYAENISPELLEKLKMHHGS